MADKLYDKDLFGDDYVPTKAERLVGQDSDVQRVFNMLDKYLKFDESVIQEHLKSEFEDFLEAMTIFNEEHPCEDGETLYKSYLQEKGISEYELYNGDVSDDPACAFVSKAAHLISDDIEKESTYMQSVDYAEEHYGTDVADLDFYSADVKENCEKAFKENPSGFANAKDLEEAVIKAMSDYGFEHKAYEAGSYGFHKYDGDEDYIETGCIFLGNGEEESQMDNLPYAMDFEAAGVNGYFDGYLKGDCIYVQNTCIVYYYVKWENVLKAGKELGLINEDEDFDKVPEDFQESIEIKDTFTRRNVD